MVVFPCERFEDSISVRFFLAGESDSPAGAGKPMSNTNGMTCGITIGSTMKTAISIDDELLEEADRTATAMGLSRSRLFGMAVGEFLQRQRREQMLVRLNEVYAGTEPAKKRLMAGIKSRARSTVKERW